ncbi:MAG: (2Fe-2S)-binding protein [Firmicutes bacterium]|jgi:predicted molibdopterin-dependent oxidoreductase YjgC|nr:(2Fe-2S)-binding protein [Bacillota bacterium]
MRITNHPLLGPQPPVNLVPLEVDGQVIWAKEGEPIAAALLAYGIRLCRTTKRRGEPRGVFCGIGHCTDCVMTVDGIPNVRTCVTPVRAGMKVTTQRGLGQWPNDH